MKLLVAIFVVVSIGLEFASSQPGELGEQKFVAGLRSRFGHLNRGPFKMRNKLFGFKFVPNRWHNQPDFLISPEVCRQTLTKLETEDAKLVDEHRFELSACIAYLLSGNFEQDPCASDEEKKGLRTLVDAKGIRDMYSKNLPYFYVPAPKAADDEDELAPT